jgi:hypothetical protein
MIWRRDELEPERSLWACVLAQAMEDIVLEDVHLSATSSRTQVCKADAVIEARASARRWIESTEYGVGGLEWICEVVMMDPEVVRAAARKKIREREEAM